MIKNRHILTYIAMLFLFMSCIKSGFDEEGCPGQYTITPVTPEELGAGEHVELKNCHTVVFYPDGIARAVETGSDKPLDLYKGAYTAIPVKGEDSNVTIDGTTVSVVTNPDGTAGDPCDFVGGYTDINVPESFAAPGIVNFDVPTKIQTRLLVLRVKFVGTNVAFIESVTGLVSGIAFSRDLNNAFTNNGTQFRYPALQNGSVTYDLDLDQEDYYTGSRRLLGIDGDASQMLTFTINYTGDVQKTYTYDITGDMDGFHSREVTLPWVIEIVIHLGADFHADIEDWKAGPEVWIDAQH